MEYWTAAGAWYLFASAATFALYAIDKRRARRGLWRIPEARLHLAEMLGGCPGGVVARRVLRHKIRSTRFLLRSWAILVVHATVWILIVVR